MNFRFLEAEDVAKTNHGKFLVVQLGACEEAVRSEIADAPLLQSLPPVRRFGGPLKAGDILLVDLQTQEAAFFDPGADDDDLRRRFLVHPLHVCILFFPVMRALAAAHRNGTLARLPGLVQLDLRDVFNQPGLLLDRTGQPVRGRFEWSPRCPLSARLRNREVVEGGDPELGQGDLTANEVAESAAARRPTW